MMKMTSVNQLLVFMKYPEEGKVKTRLASVLDVKSALVLYKRMVTCLMKKLDEPGQPFFTRIFYYPAERGADMKNWLGSTRAYMPQRGDDLGLRMENAFLDAFAGSCEKAIIIGCDVPDLSAELIIEAFDRLEGRDAVIGPSMDGGYYLVGFRREKFAPQIFCGIKWGESDVFQKTMEKFPPGFKIHILPRLRDLDTFEDLMAFSKKPSGRGLQIGELLR